MHKILITVLAAVILTCAASCGGGMSSIALDAPSVSGGNNAGTGTLPGLPVEPQGKALSGAADLLVVPGADTFMSQNATVDGTTLVLQSTAADMAYGMYKVDGLAGKKVTGFTIEMQPAALDTVYSVGVSNFSNGVWDFPVTSSLPEFEYHFSDEMERRTSALGNFYFVVIVAGGDAATVLQTTVASRALEAGEVEQPLFGDDIAASEGLADKIVVQWAAVDGSTSYELWREMDVDGVDETPELLATLPAVDSQASYAYEDLAITLGTEYKYRIRGLNAAGSGAFSRWASGWAGSAPPVGDGGQEIEFEVTDTITLIAESSIEVAGITFTTDAATIWLDDNKALVDSAAFTTGMLVEVNARSGGPGIWIADTVQMEDATEPPVDELTLTNAIEAIDAAGITVGGTLFAITLDTQWLDLNGLPVLAADFLVGDMVEIKGVADGVGGWNAAVVKHEDAGADVTISFSGAIEALSETSISVQATDFAITIDTLWQDAAGAALTPADFAVGDMVEIEGISAGAGIWNATLIKQHNAGAVELTELGTIEAIDAVSITVNGQVFATNALTAWEDTNNDPADPSLFTVGMLVEVRGVTDGMGGWLADRVRMEN